MSEEEKSWCKSSMRRRGVTSAGHLIRTIRNIVDGSKGKINPAFVVDNDFLTAIYDLGLADKFLKDVRSDSSFLYANQHVKTCPVCKCHSVGPKCEKCGHQI